jgi:simple sugar transport system ATP-binding protein
LVGVLTGLIAPDSGRVRLAGEDAPGLAERQRWRERVACVYQRSTVLPNLTVAENLFLNAHPTAGRTWINWSELRRRAERVLEEWGLEIDVTLDAARLSVEQRHIVEIARALLQGTRFIILDEPTAELEGREVARLFERIRRLQESGVTFLYISHHLEEIYEVCRSVTVLRDGAVVANAPLDAMPKERVVAAMVGEALGARTGRAPVRARDKDAPDVPPALDVRGLRLAGAVDDVSFAIAARECVGLAGLVGSGKEKLADMIVGLVRPDAGTIAVAGARLDPGRVLDARRKGVGYVPRDRHARGIVPQLSVAENLTMTIPERLGPAGLIWPWEQTRQARRMMTSLQIVAASPEQPIAELSGGNQQKSVVGRALASDPKVLVLVYPTQGVDIASKEALFGIIAKARLAGTAVLVVSDDLDELTVCDRILVIFKGRLGPEFGAEWQDEELVAAIEGIAAP